MFKEKKVAAFTDDDTQSTSTHQDPQSGADKAQSRSQGYEISELQQLVEQGDRDAMTILGNAYIEGSDIEKDQHAGVQLLKRAADLNDPRAMTLLGTHLWLDIGAMNHPNEVVQLYTRAANMGYVPGIMLLSMAYMYGYGTEQDLKEAQRLNTLLADLLDVDKSFSHVTKRLRSDQALFKQACEKFLPNFEC